MMRTFILKYIVLLGLLWVILYMDPLGVIEAMNRWQTKMTMRGISLFIDTSLIYHDMLEVSKNFMMQITHTCNGLLPFLLYATGILTYDASLHKKIFWILGGYLVLFVANILRIVVVFHLTQVNEKWYEVVHDLFGNLFIAGVVLLLLSIFFSHAGENHYNAK